MFPQSLSVYIILKLCHHIKFHVSDDEEGEEGEEGIILTYLVFMYIF
jgi:hypothetical protein